MKRLVIALLLLACSPASDTSENVTSLCEAPHRIAAVPDELKEASGLAISRRNPGILWVHNDGGAPVLFALDTLGRVRARIRIRRRASAGDDQRTGRGRFYTSIGIRKPCRERGHCVG